MADHSDSIRRNVIAGVLAGLILAAGGAIWAWVPEVWTWLSELVSQGWTATKTYLSGDAAVPRWWLLVLYASLIAWLARLAASLGRATRSNEPKIAEYVADDFFGAKWRWQYGYASRLENVWAYCPRCDTVLVYSYESDFSGNRVTTLTCETCNHDLVREPVSDKDYLVDKVRRQIDRKLRTGEWKSVVEAQTRR